jgi:hypothetical protein
MCNIDANIFVPKSVETFHARFEIAHNESGWRRRGNLEARIWLYGGRPALVLAEAAGEE